MEVTREISDRIVCAKFIFRRGSEHIDKPGIYSDGLAVLHFQDAVEMFLRATAEHLHCSIKETINFNQLIDEIDKIGKGTLTHRTALNQLNKARVNFKHFGLQPKHDDVCKFHRDLEAFFPAATSTFFNFDYDSLSLVDLIKHCRTRNFLTKAEMLLASDDFSGSVNASAIAFELYRNYAGHNESSRLRVSSDEQRKTRDLIGAIESTFRDQQDQINLIMDGINLGDYRRFKRHAPNVNFSSANTVWATWHFHSTPDKLTREDAIFCLRFAIDSILLMQQYRLPSHHMIPFPNQYYQVVRDTKIIVNPGDEPEIIRVAKVGEVLQQYYELYGKQDFIPIVQDEICAYVGAADVKLKG